jgi:hypothetical protein
VVGKQAFDEFIADTLPVVGWERVEEESEGALQRSHPAPPIGRVARRLRAFDATDAVAKADSRS